jgi:hypothetical protein
MIVNNPLDWGLGQVDWPDTYSFFWASGLFLSAFRPGKRGVMERCDTPPSADLMRDTYFAAKTHVFPRKESHAKPQRRKGLSAVGGQSVGRSVMNIVSREIHAGGAPGVLR